MMEDENCKIANALLVGVFLGLLLGAVLVAWLEGSYYQAEAIKHGAAHCTALIGSTTTKGIVPRTVAGQQKLSRLAIVVLRDGSCWMTRK